MTCWLPKYHIDLNAAQYCHAPTRSEHSELRRDCHSLQVLAKARALLPKSGQDIENSSRLTREASQTSFSLGKSACGVSEEQGLGTRHHLIAYQTWYLARLFHGSGILTCTRSGSGVTGPQKHPSGNPVPGDQRVVTAGWICNLYSVAAISKNAERVDCIGPASANIIARLRRRAAPRDT